jgi:hypothetical protein
LAPKASRTCPRLQTQITPCGTNQFVELIPSDVIGDGRSATAVRGNHPVKIEADILKSWEADRQQELLDIMSGDVLGKDVYVQKTGSVRVAQVVVWWFRERNP